MEENFFVITQKNIPDAAEFISTELKKFKIKEKEIYNAQLLAEESFLSLRDGMNGDEEFSAKVKIKKHSGKVDLIISAKGIEFNPIENLDEKLNSDDTRYYPCSKCSYRSEISSVMSAQLCFWRSRRKNWTKKFIQGEKFIAGKKFFEEMFKVS